LIYHPPNGKLSAMQPSGQKEWFFTHLV
jgi:hypothetical protein